MPPLLQINSSTHTTRRLCLPSVCSHPWQHDARIKNLSAAWQPCEVSWSSSSADQEKGKMASESRNVWEEIEVKRCWASVVYCHIIFGSPAIAILDIEGQTGGRRACFVFSFFLWNWFEGPSHWGRREKNERNQWGSDVPPCFHLQDCLLESLQS